MKKLMQSQVAILGGGAIGGVFIERLLAVGLPREQIRATETRVERQQEIERRYQIRSGLSAAEAAQSSAIVIVAVPPAAGPEVLEQIAPSLGAGNLVVSVMGGIPLHWLEQKLPHTNVARVMPNSPTLIGQGFNPVTYSERMTPESRFLLDELLAAFGDKVEVPDAQMNLMTAITAVGPTFVLPVLDAMIAAGESNGLDRQTAVRCAVSTVAGTSLTVAESGLVPEQVKLLTGLRPLKDAEVRALITEAIGEALSRMNTLQSKFQV